MKKVRSIGLLFFFALFFITDYAHSQVKADFKVNYQSVNCNPVTVSFTNLSAGVPPLSYEWNFGEITGVNSTLTDPSRTYRNCGTFNVFLKVKNGLSEHDSITIPVTIFCSPVANFNATPASGCIPLHIQFTDVSIPGNGLVNSFFWDFGDGNTGDGNSATHDYTISGCKNVTLLIKDENGCTDDTTFKSLVCVNTKPVASFFSSTSQSCTAPFTINYFSTSTGSISLNYRWNFTGGNPSTSTSSNPVVTYSKPGDFDVKLTVTDLAGCMDSLVQSNYASIASNTANFITSSNSGCIPFTLTVSGISSSVPLSWNWATIPAASPATANAQDTSFVFAITGTYQVCLNIAYPGGCEANKCTTITVGNLPVAGFSVTGNVPVCKPPLMLNYTNTSTGFGALNYKWFFPKGNPDTSSFFNPPPVEYAECGTTDAKLIVNGTAGCSDTFSLANVVTIDCPVASINGFPTLGCSPVVTQFVSIGTSGTPTFWQWNFGDTANPDSVQSVLQNPSHTFTNTGCYTIRLITGNNQGCTDTLVDSNFVCVGIPPTVNFTADPRVTCAFQNVAFRDTSTGLSGNTSFAWDFLDSPPFDVMSTDPNPFYQYTDTGWFNVTLVVCNDGCCDTLKIDSMINILPPIAKVSLERNCINPLEVTLHGESSIGADSYLWKAPGGNLSSQTDSSITVTYPADGNYHIQLIVHNTKTGCDDTASIPVDIIKVVAEFSTADTTVCSPHRVCFNNTSKNAVTYQWRIYNSSGSEIFANIRKNPCHDFLIPDVSDVMLIAKDANGCLDTVTKKKYITVYGLNLSLAGNVTSGCVPLSVTFSSNAVSLTSSLTSYRWNFGDTTSGSRDTSSFANPTHTYLNPGLYDIMLIAIDNHGCLDTLIVPQYIHTLQPEIDFSATDTTICLGQPVCFNNNSSGINLTFKWDFGDNGSSALSMPCHSYSQTGDYTVTLIGKETGGCSDTLIKPLYILVTDPHADFLADSVSSNCPPLPVNFINTSLGSDTLTSYEWLFGDGSNSNVDNPFHIYNSPGYFNVTLIMKNQYGCADTIVYDSLIHISGALATYTVTPASGCAPLNVCFIASSSNSSKNTWDFGNGDILNNAPDSICYLYKDQGIFHPVVKLDNGIGCVYSFPIDSVIVGGPFTIWQPSVTNICKNGTIQFRDSTFSAVPIQSRRWNFGDPSSGALDSSDLSNPSHYYNSAGMYTVTLIVTTNNGCDGSYANNILISPNPELFIKANDSACRNTPVVFTDSIANAVTITKWTWNFGDAASGINNTSSLQSDQHAYASDGDYIVTLIVSSSAGCSVSASVPVKVLSNPSIAVSGDVIVCWGLNSQLSTVGAASYLWSPSTYLDNASVSNPVCTPFSNITYTVTGFNTFGCSTMKTVSVEVYLPQIKSVSPNSFICSGSSIQLNAGGGLSYSWIPPAGLNNSSISNPLASPSSTTTYSAIIKDSICSSTDTLSVIVSVSPLPIANAGPDGTIFAGESYPIKANASGTILWSPKENLSCYDCEDPVASPLQTTTYMLQTTNADGCRNADNMVIRVLCPNDILYIPDIFSPNGNGKNDVFRIRSDGIKTLSFFRIYDRWGEMVFETSDLDSGWDGTFNGKLLPPAVYIFYFEAICSNGDEVRKHGNITLAR